MGLTTVQDWIAWAALALPILGIFWSAYRYVEIQKKEREQRDFENFFAVLARVNNADKSLILQTAAVFELRFYGRYKEFILRLCENAPSLFGPSPDQRLLSEFELTARHLRGKE